MRSFVDTHDIALFRLFAVVFAAAATVLTALLSAQQPMHAAVVFGLLFGAGAAACATIVAGAAGTAVFAWRYRRTR